MLIPIRQAVRLSGGNVILRAWSARGADANLLDLLTLCATLSHLREEWQAFRREDVMPEVWGAFWRLVHASLEQGSTLPDRLTWNDRLTLLTAMLELNDIEEAESKLKALSQRVGKLLRRTQGLTMTA